MDIKPIFGCYYFLNGVQMDLDYIHISNIINLPDCIKISGIPLSIDWLRKANYKQLRRVEKTYSLSNFEDNSAIYFTGVRFIHIKTGTQLDYVHEWQNLYSSIHKKELNFNL